MKTELPGYLLPQAALLHTPRHRADFTGAGCAFTP